jgi:hypothetical protein
LPHSVRNQVSYETLALLSLLLDETIRKPIAM